jgi:hypothetical protein
MVQRALPSPSHTRRPAHEVRIIGGQWKRTKLPVSDKPGLRPTPDRVRETLFNWLGQDLTGWRCLDAFAGTGALGLEAASRGASDVLLVEQDPQLVAQLRAIQAKLDARAVKVERANGLTVLARSPAGGLDLVFLDPPSTPISMRRRWRHPVRRWRLMALCTSRHPRRGPMPCLPLTGWSCCAMSRPGPSMRTCCAGLHNHRSKGRKAPPVEETTWSIT